VIAAFHHIVYKASKGDTAGAALALGTTAKDLLAMTKNALPAIAYLRQRLRYDPQTGKLNWLAHAGSSPAWNGRWAGREAGSHAPSDGYSKVALDRRMLKAHRVAWAVHHGVWPAGEIDHINHIKTDNCIANLRDVTLLENRRNQRMKQNNTSGVTGVSWCKQTQSWKAQIHPARKCVHLGRFVCLKDAIDARKAAEARYGFHLNHGAGSSPTRTASED
jgi:uncharacterized protein YeaC (DUF1315 family)